jgi:fatty-acyl-CoA synthase
MDGGIGRWVGKRALLQPDEVAFVEPAGAGERETTWRRFEERTNRLASALVGLGVRRGDRLGILMLNSVALVEVVLAAAKLGAIAVPINFRLTGGEVGFLLADSGADVLFTQPSLRAVAGAALDQPGTRVRHLVVDGPGPGAGRPAAVAGDRPAAAQHSYQELVAGGCPDPLDMDVDPGDVHAIMYTSGTTGRPKGAMLTHANALANANNYVSSGRGLHAGDVTVTAAPLFHIGGLGVLTLPGVYVGLTNVVVPAFEPVRYLEAMARHRATVAFLVPAMWAALTRVPDFDGYDLSSLEACLSGGAPTPLTVIEFFQAKGLPFQEGFGMTETAPAVSVLDPAHVKAKAGSIGRPLLAVDARLVDADDREVAAGQVGELVLRGANIFAGYWMQPAATAEAFRGGWFHTGDMGKVDEEGFITLVDRKKDMIISGGENVYPVEVEQVLYRHPAVREAAVFGVPDDRWGETVVAAVACESEPGDELAAEIIAWCRDRLAHFKCPTRVVWTSELPRNATGKVLKTRLRAEYGGTARAVSR